MPSRKKPKKRALICGKWELPFYIDVVSESEVPLHRRSYTHYAAEHPELVDSKCLATAWLLEALQPSTAPVVEYLAGVGFVSTIVREMLYPPLHRMYEKDERCVDQLKGVFAKKLGVKVEAGDAKETMLQGASATGAYLDFPHFTVNDLQKDNGWAPGFRAVFASTPDYVVFTDTAASLLPVHRKKYSEILGATVTDTASYAQAFGNWLLRETGYGAARAALRGKNASYFLCLPGEHSGMEVRNFPVNDKSEGFRWIE